MEKEKDLSKEEYLRLVQTAPKKRKITAFFSPSNLFALPESRISELQFITVEAVKSGYANVDCKGKQRVIFLPKKLQQLLKNYIKKQGI